MIASLKALLKTRFLVSTWCRENEHDLLTDWTIAANWQSKRTVCPTKLLRTICWPLERGTFSPVSNPTHKPELLTHVAPSKIGAQRKFCPVPTIVMHLASAL